MEDIKKINKKVVLFSKKQKSSTPFKATFLL